MEEQEVLSTVTSKGQVTIPARVRKWLGVKAGERIAFILEPGGTVRVAVPQYRTVADLRGAAGSLKQPRPWKEVLRIAREDAHSPDGNAQE
jgi:AbrB family looped-hinge helix DNA binding protein